MKKVYSPNRQAFSLIELLVVIAITAVLLAVALPNLLSTRERARDAKRKQELSQMKNALRMYFNDHQEYPADTGDTYVVGKMHYIVGCGPNATEVTCPCTVSGVSVDFAVGANCETVYMKKFPSEFGSNTLNYYQVSGGDDFCLEVTLDNAADGDIATSQSRCSVACSAYCNASREYCMCAD